MKPENLEKGTKLFFIEWNPNTLDDVSTYISEVEKVEKEQLYDIDHVDILLYPVIGICESYSLYDSIELNEIYIERYDFDLDVFITANENLFNTILYQLIHNRTYNKELIRRVLYYY